MERPKTQLDVLRRMVIETSMHDVLTMLEHIARVAEMESRRSSDREQAEYWAEVASAIEMADEHVEGL